MRDAMMIRNMSMHSGACSQSHVEVLSIPEGSAIEQIQSRLIISSLLKLFKTDLNVQPQVSIRGARLVYRKGLYQEIQSAIDRLKCSTLAAAIEMIQSPGPLGL